MAKAQNRQRQQKQQRTITILNRWLIQRVMRVQRSRGDKAASQTAARLLQERIDELERSGA